MSTGIDQPCCVWSIHRPGADPISGKGNIYGWGSVADPLDWGRDVPEVKRWIRSIDAGRKVLTVLLGTPAAPLQILVAATLARNLMPVNPRRRWIPCTVVTNEGVWKFKSISAAAAHLKMGVFYLKVELHRTPTGEVFDNR